MKEAHVATLLRRSFVPSLLVACFTLTIADAQTPPAPRLEQEALTAAMAIKEPAGKLDALQKIRADYPQTSILTLVDSQILATLVNNFPDRVDAVTEVFDRIIGRISA